MKMKNNDTVVFESNSKRILCEKSVMSLTTINAFNEKDREREVSFRLTSNIERRQGKPDSTK